MPQRIGVVADDLTGATDAAVAFAGAGWRTELRLQGSETTRPGSVITVATGSRALPSPRAAERTERAVRTMIDQGADRLLIKIDSTVRGSVAAQVDGARRAWGQAHPSARILVCPAFPALGRTLVDGIVLVHGVPVSETAAATDPVTPIRTSSLPEIVGDDVVILDAGTDADLDRIADLVADAGPELIMVGSGGIAAALARRWRLGQGPEPELRAEVLVAMSSLHPTSLRQVDLLRDRHPHLAIIRTAAEADRSAGEVAEEFADQTVAALRRSPYAAVILIGGDGAGAVLERLGATGVALHGEIAPGVPVGTVIGGLRPGLQIITKSGGFGCPTTLVDILDRHTTKEAS